METISNKRKVAGVTLVVLGGGWLFKSFLVLMISSSSYM